MLTDQCEPVAEHLPRGEPRGVVLVISDYRPLNLGHAAAVSLAGYAVYTAVTCTDVPRVFEQFTVGDVDLIVFASLVHGWHHREAEPRPESMPEQTDHDWQTRNIREVIDVVGSRQGRPPKVLVAIDLMTSDCYDVTADALSAAGVEYQTYSASSPHSIVSFLQRVHPGVVSGAARPATNASRFPHRPTVAASTLQRDA